MPTDPNIPEGFPDLFVYQLKNSLETALSVDPDFPATSFITRQVRADDPSRTIAVVENDAEPAEYEIAGRMDPSLMRWSVWIFCYAKHSNEVEGRNVRKRLMNRCRKALRDPAVVSALMTLNDGFERVSRYKMRRMEFQAADARDRNSQFFFLGMIEIVFDTELL